VNIPWIRLMILALACLWGQNTSAQNRVAAFNQPWPGYNEFFAYWTYADASGLLAQITPQAPDNYFVLLTAAAGHPTNGTPHIQFKSYHILSSSTLFRLPGQSPFGLISVDLADPVAPSLAPIDITFNGFRADGSMVSQTFTVGGAGSSSFQRVYFGPAFAHGLVRVEIPSPAWAMDNIVWIPEPDSAALLGLGLLAWAARRFPRPDRS